MPRNGTGRPRCTLDQGMRRKTGQDNGTFTTSQHSIHSYDDATHGILAELEEAPLIPLAALLCSDASPREIVRRLRLNLAIRLLVDAIHEREVAS